ncbi:hypothetical protein [Streptomyces sp. NPDC053069]|uniref:hypothetical protein n=1 Tax=Streptomyces sp. NPDC053069 TaxID=3365695 RepID=UPI0037D24063
MRTPGARRGQQQPAGQRGDQAVQRALRTGRQVQPALPQAQGAQEGLRQNGGVPQCGQFHEAHLVAGRRRHLRGQPRLADASRTGQGHQPAGAEELPDLGTGSEDRFGGPATGDERRMRVGMLGAQRAALGLK